ncbi:hypothetical protein AAVH_21590, partial [Aphelenchoides avenae]
IVVPLATLVGPALVIAFAVYLGSPLLKYLFPYMAQLMASHSLLNSVLMVLCTQPYRCACRKMIARVKVSAISR